MNVPQKHFNQPFSFRANAHSYKPGASLTKPIKIPALKHNLRTTISDEMDSDAWISADINKH